MTTANSPQQTTDPMKTQKSTRSHTNNSTLDKKNTGQGVSTATIVVSIGLRSHSCWITHDAIPPGTQGKTLSEVTNQTLAGTFSSIQELTLSNALLPDFHRSQNINNI